MPESAREAPRVSFLRRQTPAKLPPRKAAILWRLSRRPHNRSGATIAFMRALLSTLVCLSLLLPLQLDAAGFYFREQEGWFWYEREPELPPAPEAPPPTEPAAPPQPPLAETAPEGPRTLSAEWLREHIGEYRDLAIDDPTPENVALYLYLQRVALDKSSRFAAATQRAVQLDPFLDEITQRPTATFAANLTNRQAGDQRDAALARIAERAGVLFFFRSDCPYCEAQAPLLKLLENRFGFSMLAVSLDGAPLPGGEFPSSAGIGVRRRFLAWSPPRRSSWCVPRCGGASVPGAAVLRAAPGAHRPRRGGGRLDRPGRVQAHPPGHRRSDAGPSALPGALPDDPAALLAALRALARAQAGPSPD